MNEQIKWLFNILEKSPAPAASSRLSEGGITHRRFLGYDDHEVRILIQKPKEEEPQKNVKKYACPKCQFQTPRIEVFMMHKKSHIQGVYTTTCVPAKKAKRAMKIPRTKTSTIDEDIALLRKGLPLTTDPSELEVEKPTKAGRSPKPKEKKETAEVAKPTKAEDKTDIAKSILSQWDDDDEEEIASEKNLEEESSKSKSDVSKQTDKSCFDFTEDDENELVTATGKRKIPRVIPVNEKQKVEDETFDKLISSPSKSEEQTSKDDKQDENKKNDPDEAEFMELLESTAVPTLPEVPSLKCEQNFPDAKTIKFPDKQTEKEEQKTEVATKLTNPKKRFVKSFEDFELSQNAQKKSDDTKPIADSEKTKKDKLSDSSANKELPETEEKTNADDKTHKNKGDSEKDKFLEVSKLKTQLMSKLNTSGQASIRSLRRKTTETSDGSDSSPKQRFRGRYKSRISESEASTSQKQDEESSAKDMPKDDKQQKQDNADAEEKSDSSKKQETSESAKEHKKESDSKNDKPAADVESETTPKVDVSALSTLAAVSELTSVDSASKYANTESELVSVDKNVTIVTEKELADGQVEFADVSTAVTAKPLTLSSFSLDFSDSNNDSVKAEEPPIKKIKSSDGNKEESKSKANLITKEETETETAENKAAHPVVESAKQKELETCSKPAAKNSGKVAKSSGGLDLEEQIPPSIVCNTGTVESQMAKLTDTNPEHPQSAMQHQSTTSTKLLEILTDAKQKSATATRKIVLASPKEAIESCAKAETTGKPLLTRHDAKVSKYVVKSASMKATNKPTILSEKIIKPMSDTVSVQKVTTTKRTYQDVEDIDAFIIQKPSKKLATSAAETVDKTPIKKTLSKPAGKAKILQQTIITPTGDIIQPDEAQTSDDNMFDINSMPIVLSDQILTPENIDGMPIVLSDSTVPIATTKMSNSTEKLITTVKKPNTQVKLLNKSAAVTSVRSPAIKSPTFIKTYASAQGKGNKNQKVYQVTPKLLKTNPAIISQHGKPGKFIIVPSGTTPTGAKYNIEKRVPITKRVSVPNTNVISKVQNITPEPTGNKIMIVTNQQGQQSRVLLTPAQQKLLGYQTGTKIKGAVKGGTAQKSVLTTKGTVVQSSSGAGKTLNIMVSQAAGVSKPSQNIIGSSGQLLTPLTAQQLKTLKGEGVPKTTKKLSMQGQRVLLNPMGTPKNTIISGAKTPVARSQQSTIAKKMPVVDEALLDQQVQEQIQAINKASAVRTQTKVELQPAKPTVKPPAKRSYAKKHVVSESLKYSLTGNSKTQVVLNTAVNKPVQAAPAPKTEVSLPPLAPISPAKKETPLSNQTLPETTPTTPEKKLDRPLNQLIIQDVHGNQTTITEGQILALPSETVDGQPQSYMLVTLDETGNLTPLNNEALMSLDPNLGLGGDLSNMVLQIDSGATTPISQVSSEATEAVLKKTDSTAVPTQESVLPATQPVDKPEPALAVATESVVVSEAATEQPSAQATLLPKQNVDLNPESVTCTLNSDSNQQFIVTGDPIAAQKLIESLTEGNTDLANILAGAENILIQADGQQILINADSENQMLLSVNAENLNVTDNSSISNPIFAAQPSKSQDILAAALADTDVFQPDQNGQHLQNKAAQSQLSPNSNLYPMNVGNVLETSLTLSSPIMTPLEVPSTNNKKIVDDETDILTQVPKNVDLPITITDPNISQTVSQQQVASLIASELQTNLELPLSISDANMSISTSELNSPSYVYSLPSLDDTVDVGHRAFSSSISMPSLSEDTDSQSKSADEKETVSENEPVDKEQTESSVDSVNTEPNQPKDTVLPNEPQKEPEHFKQNESEGEIRSTAGSFMEEGLCTLGGEMCSSLSEPPPDMFDLSMVNPTYTSSDLKQNSDIPVESATVTEQSENTANQNELFAVGTDLNPHLEKYSPYDDPKNNNGSVSVADVEMNPSNLNIDQSSCELPVQPDIVTDSNTFELCESNQTNDVSTASLKRDYNGEEETDAKRLKID